MPAVSSESITERIRAYLADPANFGKSDVEVAQVFGVHRGTVARNRLSTRGPNGGILVTVNVDQIEVDQRYQLRTIDGGLDLEAVDDYAANYERGGEMPPVLVVDLEGTYKLVGGFHRYAGARKAGLADINAEVIPGTEMDALVLASKSNSQNGLRYTKKDKRNACEVLLKTYPELMEIGPREFERRTGIHEATFRKIRSELKAQAAADDPDTLPSGEPVEKKAKKEKVQEWAEGGGGSVDGGNEPDSGDDDEGDDDEAQAEVDSEIYVQTQRHPSIKSLPSDEIRLLMQSQVFMSLEGDRLATFVAEYKYRRDIAEVLGQLKAAHEKAKPKTRIQPVVTRLVESIVGGKTYIDAALCGECRGKGCDKCHKRGYTF